jgi:hypothetical protein
MPRGHAADRPTPLMDMRSKMNNEDYRDKLIFRLVDDDAHKLFE